MECYLIYIGITLLKSVLYFAATSQHQCISPKLSQGGIFIFAAKRTKKSGFKASSNVPQEDLPSLSLVTKKENNILLNFLRKRELSSHGEATNYN